MNNEPHALKLVPIDSKVFFWLLKSAAKHHWYASIKGLVFSLIITSDHPSRLSLKSFFAFLSWSLSDHYGSVGADSYGASR